jgi:hypothetical protein
MPFWYLFHQALPAARRRERWKKRMTYQGLMIAAAALLISASPAMARDYSQDLAICKGRAAQVADRGYCQGLLMCALQVASDNQIQDTIVAGCMAELGWKTR